MTKKNISSSYGEQVIIANTAIKNGSKVKIIEKEYHDEFFIVNNSKNPVKINNEEFKFIYMSAEEATACHNRMFIVASNNEKEIEEWKI